MWSASAPQPQFCHRLAGVVSSALLLTALLRLSPAQVVRTALTPDTSLGTTVTQQGNVHSILGGRRPNNGPNLFHSFDRFSVGTGDIADFRGATGITNILSRVTGGQRSEIDGTLRSTMPRGQSVSAQSQWGPLWAERPAGCGRGLSREHGGLPAPGGWEPLFRALVRHEHAECGCAGGLWVSAETARPGSRFRVVSSG